AAYWALLLYSHRHRPSQARMGKGIGLCGVVVVPVRPVCEGHGCCAGFPVGSRSPDYAYDYSDGRKDPAVVFVKNSAGWRPRSPAMAIRSSMVNGTWPLTLRDAAEREAPMIRATSPRRRFASASFARTWAAARCSPSVMTCESTHMSSAAQHMCG